MDFINIIIEKIINNFDFSYIISINLITYFIIKLVDYLNKEKIVTVLQKRIILIVSIIIMFGIYSILGYNNYIVLINSSIFAPVFWSWFLRPIINKLGIGYKSNIK